MKRPASPMPHDLIAFAEFQRNGPPVIGPAPLDVRSLVCHVHLNMAVRCLASFQRCCAEPHRLTVHDDGSLTIDDIERLKAELNDVRIVTRAEADDLVCPVLRDYPNCAAFRRDVVFGPKLLDMPLMCGDGYAYTDHDILYQRRFTGFGPSAREPADLVYMQDLSEAYSLTFRQRYLERPRLRLPDRVNAGLMYVAGGAFDLDVIEWFLGLRQYQVQPFLVEQTAWAVMAGRLNSSFWNPAQMGFPTGDATDAHCVALHFITPLRKALATTPDTRIDRSDSPVTLTTLPAHYTSLPEALFRKTIDRARAG